VRNPDTGAERGVDFQDAVETKKWTPFPIDTRLVVFDSSLVNRIMHELVCVLIHTLVPPSTLLN
jgi:hypothetical protein